MAENPRSIHQFRALRWLDEFFGVPDADERRRRCDAALARLEARDFELAGRTVARVEEAGGTNSLRHFEEHWLSGEYWPSISADHIRDQVRSGFREALTAARDRRLPVISIWVCASDDPKSTDFRVDHVVGATAVMVAIMTPRPSVEV
jgi:hypothetical protein